MINHNIENYLEEVYESTVYDRLMQKKRDKLMLLKRHARQWNRRAEVTPAFKYNAKMHQKELDDYKKDIDKFHEKLGPELSYRGVNHVYHKLNWDNANKLAKYDKKQGREVIPPLERQNLIKKMTLKKYGLDKYREK